MALIGWFVRHLSCCIDAIPISDHWKVSRIWIYIKWYENGYSSSILLRYATVHYSSTNDLNTLIVQSTHQNVLKRALSSTFHSLLWSEPDAIINEHDSVQILNHTYIFYKQGQTRMTQLTRMTQPSFNPDTHITLITYIKLMIVS